MKKGEVGSKFDIGDLVKAALVKKGKTIEGIIRGRKIVLNFRHELVWEYKIKFINEKGEWEGEWVREDRLTPLITGIFE